MLSNGINSVVYWYWIDASIIMIRDKKKKKKFVVVILNN